MAQPIDRQTGRPAEPGDVDFVYGESYENPIDKALGESRYTLGRAETLLGDTGRQAKVAGEDAAQLEQQRQREGAYKEPPMSLRRLTDMAEMAALPVGIAGMVPTPASPFLLGASTALGAAGGVRKLLNPDEDESRAGGAGQLAFAALPSAVGKGIQGLRGLGGQAMKRFPISAEKAYRGADSMENLSGLNEQPQSLAALRRMMEARQPQVPDEIMQKLSNAWKQFASVTSPAVAKSAPKIKRTPKGLLSKMGRESEAGYRNVPHSDNPLLDVLPEGGLGQITPAEWKRLGLKQVQNDIPAYLDETADWGGDLFEQLAQREGRLSIPARARAFREQK